MTKSFSDLMRDVRSLVSGQRLDEATAAIEQALNRARPGQGAPPHAGPTIDLKAGPGAAANARALAEKLASYGAGRPRFRMPDARPPQAGVPVPHGASFATLLHQGPQGSRSYKLYVPSVRPAGPMPLILMLHGCTQNPDDFALGTGMNALAEETGFLVAYPEQPQSANARLCWNWFEPAHQKAGRGEPAILAGIVEDIASAQAVDRSAIFVAGLSAGGAMAAVMGATYPRLFAGVGVHSGLPYGAASDVGSALALMRSGRGGSAAAGASGPRPRLIVFHGDADRTVHAANGSAVAGPATAGDRVESGVAGGRSYARIVRSEPAVEYWSVEGLGHAWSGGNAAGSFADPAGPQASREMVRFFLTDRSRS